MYERILVPLDSSKLADMVLPYAEVLAGALDSEVTLLYVCEPKEEPYRRVHEFYLGKISELVKSHIREYLPAKKNTRIKVKSLVPCGKPSEEISNYAKKNNSNLIVMARHGRSGIMRRLMAPIADKVFQATGVPLLLITTSPPPEPSPMGLLNRILLPLDGLESGEVALPYIRELVKKLSAEVILLQVIAPVYPARTLRGLDYVKFNEQQIESMTVNAKQYLEKVGEKLADTKATLRYEVRVGDPAAEIIDFADKIKARLVAISTHHYSGTSQWHPEEIAQRILQATKTPVLLVKGQG
jgi:nucleotide-binding universal stress UspA family protein